VSSSNSGGGKGHFWTRRRASGFGKNGDRAEAARATTRGLTEDRKALVERYTIDAETAESRGPHAPVNLLPRAATGQTVAPAANAATLPETRRAELPTIATEGPAAQGIRRGTLSALLILSSAGGLLLVSAADALSRSGHPHGGVLFWLGLFAIFLPVTARLASRTPTRHERVALLVLLGLASYLVKVLRDPFRFLYTDEFVHQYNVLSILATHRLFRENPFLPATPAYPGLEAPTAALSALTGMSTFAAGLVISAVARLILMLALFLLYETVTGSGRLAGLAAALYAASPHFLFFIADFSYESLALPIAVLALAAALRARPPSGLGARAWLVVALVLTAGVVVTHHMTSYALIATLLAICLLPLPWVRERLHRPWSVALVAIAVTAAWLTLVARETTGYLSPVLLGALRETIRTAQGEAQVRKLFQSHGGAGQGPAWEHYLAFTAVLIATVGILFGVRAIWRRYRHFPAPLVFALAGIAYVASLTLRLVPAAWETAVRSSEFLFIGGALALALFGLWLLERFPGRRVRFGLVAALALLLMGDVISTTPSATRLAEPYRVSVRGGTVIPQAATAAQWAGRVLGPGNRIAAGEADGRFLLVDGRQHVFAGTNPPIATILKTRAFPPWQIGVLRRNGIRYVVTDRQPSGGDAANGYYFFRDRRDKALSHARMKFARAGAEPIYDSGDIVVYDLPAALTKGGNGPHRRSRTPSGK
jgi:hypothetical protein